jgi:hypothetical protein
MHNFIHVSWDYLKTAFLFVGGVGGLMKLYDWLTSGAKTQGLLAEGN